MNRWSMSKEWVTEPSLTNDTLAIDAASGVSMVRVAPGSATEVALVIVGRGASVPFDANRYGG